MFYTLIKHGFLTNQSARRVLSDIIIKNKTKNNGVAGHNNSIIK